MKYKHIIISMCFFSFFAHSKIDESSNINTLSLQSSTQDIDNFLIKTDEIRTSDFKVFSKNLSALNKIKPILLANQLCKLNFLNAYKLGLGGDFKDSILQLNEIQQDCKDKPITIKTESLLANLYAISGEYQKALTHLDSILNKVENVQNVKLKHLIYSTAYIVYDLVDENQLSLDFSQLVINDKPSENTLCKAYSYKYIAILKLKDLDFDETEINKIIHQCIKNNENLYAEILHVSLFEYLLMNIKSQNDIQSIYDKLLKSDNDINATKYSNLIVFKNSLFARILEKLGKFNEAIDYAKLAIEGSLSIGNTKQKIYAFQVLINIYQKDKNYKEANKYLIEKNLAEKKLYSDKQAKMMAYQTVKHDSLAKSLQIKFLNQENKVLQLDKELAEKSKTNQLLLSYFFASLTLLLLYIGYRFRKQQQVYKSLSEMDFMTKIYNRKGIKDYMAYLLSYSEKKQETIAFGIFDLDLFKRVNDQYGHNVGDWVIKSTIKACKKLNNEKATFARLGGEEFAIIIRDSNLQEMIDFAEQCRQAISNINTLKDTGYAFQISASFGVTSSQQSGYDFSQLMSNADDALYKSKETGRNKVTVYINPEPNTED